MAPYEIPALAGKPYRPSNGTEGSMFEAKFCDRCKLDAEWREHEKNPCLIHNMALAVAHDHPSFPKEWTHDNSGHPTCTAFKEEDAP